MQAITDPQYSYLKSLIKKVGQEFYQQTRANEKIDTNLTERQLSKKQAQRLIGLLKVEGDRGKPSSSFGAGFEVETPYGTTMLADSDEELLKWARKRFEDKPTQLKKLEAFLEKVHSTSVEISGYKIKRSNS